MASGLYKKFKENLLKGAVGDLTALTIKAVLVDIQGGTGYTVDFVNDQFLSSIPALARVATSGALTTKTVTGGTFDADDVVFSLVTGAQSEAVVLYVDTGSAATSTLICYLDSTAVTGIPVTPGGGDIDIVWDNGTNKIFTL